MRGVLSGLLALVSIAGAWSPASGAEAGKLRYVMTVYVDTKGAGMKAPEGVACNDKTLLVADTGTNRVLRYALQNGAPKPVAELQTAEFAAPIAVGISAKDEVLALDGKQRRIVRFAANGEYKGPVRAEGVPAPTTIVPRSFRIDANDDLYVLDVFSARVLVLGLDGKYKRHLPFPKAYGFFSDLAVDGKGTIFLLDSIKATVWVAAREAKEFAPLGASLRQQVSFPTAISVDSRGVLYVVDQHGSGVLVIGQDGVVIGRQLAMGWTEGLVYYPAQLCVTDKGQVAIADRGNNRVQIFSLVR